MEARGGRLELRSRGPAWMVALVGLLTCAMASLLVLAESPRGLEVVTCSRVEAACTVAAGRQAPVRFPVAALRRFSVREDEVRGRRSRQTTGVLVAVTSSSETEVAHWGLAQLRRDAARLDAFLAGGESLTLRYDHAAQDLKVGLGLLVFFALFWGTFWMFFGPWSLTIDPAAGEAVRRRPLWPARRWRLSDLREAGVWIPWLGLEAQVRRPIVRKISWLVVVDGEGRRWQVSCWLQPGQVTAAATEVARLLEDVFRRTAAQDPRRGSPPGTVPPPLP